MDEWHVLSSGFNEMFTSIFVFQIADDSSLHLNEPRGAPPDHSQPVEPSSSSFETNSKVATPTAEKDETPPAAPVVSLLRYNIGSPNQVLLDVNSFLGISQPNEPRRNVTIPE